jgi:hypothetical protein
VSPVKYKLGFYIPEDDILHSYRRKNLKSYTGHSHRYEVTRFRMPSLYTRVARV